MNNYSCLVIMDSRGKRMHGRINTYNTRAGFPIDITLETVSGATIAELLNQAIFILSQGRYGLVIFMGGGGK